MTTYKVTSFDLCLPGSEREPKDGELVLSAHPESPLPAELFDGWLFSLLTQMDKIATPADVIDARRAVIEWYDLHAGWLRRGLKGDRRPLATLQAYLYVGPTAAQPAPSLCPQLDELLRKNA